jgi:hypothetical protein
MVVVTQPPEVSVPTLAADGSLTLEIRAGTGETLVLETSVDLETWVEARTLNGLGWQTPIPVTLTPDITTTARFWRVVRR